VPKEIVLPAAVIDKSNTASQAVPVEQRSCPRWEDAVKS
jgi:ribose transport system substrate-binding protein